MWKRALGAALFAVAFFGAPRPAHAEERVRFLAEKLKSDDFRVRTNAALALGVSNEDSAVPPLCGALSDSSDVVRQASAVAMKRLNRSAGIACLKDREGVEPNDGVKVQITRAIEAITANGDGASNSDGDEKVKENANAKYYIALSTVANATGRPQSEVESVVLKALRSKLESAKTMQLAPTKETPSAARSVISKRKLKGFYLAIAVDRFDYSNGNLRVRVKLGIFTYPGKSLIGDSDKTLTKGGIGTADKASEDTLMDLAASLVGEQFAQSASAF
jgi:hypothetical protein